MKSAYECLFKQHLTIVFPNIFYSLSITLSFNKINSILLGQLSPLWNQDNIFLNIYIQEIITNGSVGFNMSQHEKQRNPGSHRLKENLSLVIEGWNILLTMYFLLFTKEANLEIIFFSQKSYSIRLEFHTSNSFS